MNVDFVPDWPNIDFGLVENQRFGRRILRMVGAVWRMLRETESLAKADVVVARNFDMLWIAWAVRLLTGHRRAPLVYECLDIHGLFTGRRSISAVMRWCERRLLARVDLLIVSSPGFIENYFEKIQGYKGVHAIIENKLWFDDPAVTRPKRAINKRPAKPIILGWVGSIRCQASFELLVAAADALGAALEIHVHGNIHHHAILDFDETLAARDNFTYFGPYNYPDDLSEIYGSIDLVWAQDLWQRGANSDWLLPNRIYEASWFGCPSLAVADTQTGHRVDKAGLGFTIEKATADKLIKMLKGLSRAKIDSASSNLMTIADDNFRLLADDVAVAMSRVMPQEAQEPGTRDIQL